MCQLTSRVLKFTDTIHTYKKTTPQVKPVSLMPIAIKAETTNSLNEQKYNKY